MPLSQNTLATIGTSSAQYGADGGFLAALALHESSGNPNAKNPYSSASGLFQFLSGTARQWGISNPFDVQQSVDGAARASAYNAAQLGTADWKTNYLAWQQGLGGAKALLGNPNALAVDVVGRNAVVNNGGNPNMTAGQFADFIGNSFMATAEKNAPGAAASGGYDFTGRLKSLFTNPFGPATSAAEQTMDGASAPILSAVGDWFSRGSLILLGLIFVAAGLFALSRRAT